MQTEAEVLTDISRAERKQKREAVKLNGVNSHARRKQQREEKMDFLNRNSKKGYAYV